MRGANHNGYNRTLVRLRNDDAAGAKGACARARRPSASSQQAFLARVAVDHLSHAMLGTPAAAWQAPGAAPSRLYGRSIVLGADRVTGEQRPG